MAGERPVDRLRPTRPTPSILTTARDRSRDGFGIPLGVQRPESATDDQFDALERQAGVRLWDRGISWLPSTCQTSATWPMCPGAEDEKDAADARAAVVVAPFWIYTPLDCEWLTAESNDLPQQAQDLTEAHSAFMLARALWLGDGLPDELTQPTLRRSSSEVGAAATSPVVAISILLAAYEACTGGNGGAVLHVPTQLIPGLLTDHTIVPAGNQYLGPLGSLVSPGPGYPAGASAAGTGGVGPRSGGTEPNETYLGNLATEAWIYVSGPVEYALGNIVTVPDSEMEQRGLGQHRQNKIELYGERMGIVRFDPCCVFGALATAPDTSDLV